MPSMASYCNALSAFLCALRGSGPQRCKRILKGLAFAIAAGRVHEAKVGAHVVLAEFRLLLFAQDEGGCLQRAWVAHVK